MKRSSVLFLGVIMAILPLLAAPGKNKKTSDKAKIQGLSPFKVPSSFKVPKEFEVRLFAGSDLIDNPVSIAIDAKGRVYVAETQRFARGVEDSRRHQYWFLDEIKINSLQGRLDLFDKWTRKGKFPQGHFTNFSDRIITLEDKNGDGKADSSKVVAGKFNDPLDGNAGSILLGGDGEMFFAEIPHIWKITDEDGDGVSEKREKIFSGFGFRNGVNGHDLHGLEWGVDGRLYFTNGDRGFRVKTKEGGVLESSERGAIFRCEADGSNLEIFTIGNRNPQDLAFNQYGNLFTVDNNRGRGDSSRVCYLVELGDYGWNSGHENKSTFFKATKLNERKGPAPSDNWVEEGDWKEEFDGQAAYSIPSIFFIDGGSAGMTFNPGDSLGASYKNKFMFSAYQNGIYAFDLLPHGAGLKKKTSQQFWQGGLIMDTQFDYDGRFYAADYVATFNRRDGSSKGGIYMLENDEYLKQKSVVDAAKKLKAGFENVASLELLKNLAHEDMRVRMYSQFELVKRGQQGAEVLVQALAQKENELARLHAVWGLGQLARQQNTYNRLLLPFVNDTDWRVRANIAKVIGESKDAKYLPQISHLLKDNNKRVKFFAATAIGKLSDSKEIVKTLMNEAQQNKDQDIYLRHSIVAGLTYSANANAVRMYTKHSSAAVRKVALLTLTRLKDHSVIDFLQDSDSKVIREAVRAIDRMNIDEVTMKAAAFLKSIASGKVSLEEMEIERVLQWNFREGSSQSVENVLGLILNKELSTRIRLIAINDLLRWSEIPPIDPVNGQIRSINPQRAEVKGATVELVKALQDDKSDKEIHALVMGLAIKYGLAKNMNTLSLKILDQNEFLATRLDLLRKLTQANDPSVKGLLGVLLNDRQKAMRREALIILHKIDSALYSSHMNELLSKQKDLQVAYSVLSALKDEKHSKYIVTSINLLMRNKHAADSVLELLEAAETLKNPAVKKRLAAYKKLQGNDELFEFTATMSGGDKIRGRQLVYQQGIGQCIICHKIEDKGGVVAPDLSNIAAHKRSTKKYLLESIIKPSAYVVPGFGNITLNLKDGSSIVASLISKDKKKIIVKLISGESVTYPISKVKSSTDPISSMPPMGGILNKYDLRDIIAYLTSLKTAKH